MSNQAHFEHSTNTRRYARHPMEFGPPFGGPSWHAERNHHLDHLERKKHVGNFPETLHEHDDFIVLEDNPMDTPYRKFAPGRAQAPQEIEAVYVLLRIAVPKRRVRLVRPARTTYCRSAHLRNLQAVLDESEDLAGISSAVDAIDAQSGSVQ